MSDQPGLTASEGERTREEPTKHRIECHLDCVLAQRGMTLTELSRQTGITMANLSILKTNKAKAIRFTTLTAICDVLDTTPAQLFTIRPG
ncbi:MULTISPECIES: helix-turn-helix domain-containing protein [unclassified Arthrobacter]|uniref:helix-turn-helix domain-containing protein n=1 Tax=unclassified Arthrobacter TaxID=235627 RepID=UPI000463A96E|nr:MULTISPECIES: helix-turn-helix transcriptional regulator [unclassified Arthrobacter]